MPDTSAVFQQQPGQVTPPLTTQSGQPTYLDTANQLAMMYWSSLGQSPSDPLGALVKAGGMQAPVQNPSATSMNYATSGYMPSASTLSGQGSTTAGAMFTSGKSPTSSPTTPLAPGTAYSPLTGPNSIVSNPAGTMGGSPYNPGMSNQSFSQPQQPYFGSSK
jgi:hypothetical protein